MQHKTISITEAAHRLGMSYPQVLRLVLIGTLEGRKAGTRWCVSIRDVECLRRQRRRTVSVTA